MASTGAHDQSFDGGSFDIIVVLFGSQSDFFGMHHTCAAFHR